MNKLQLIVLSVIIPFSAMAYAIVVPKLGAPTPLQTYESAGSAPSKAKSPKTTAPAKKRTLTSKANTEVAKELESQMNELNRATLLFQQETNQKIENLVTQNDAVKAKLQKLTQAMLMINQQLSVLGNAQGAHSSVAKASKAKTHSISFSGLFKYFAFGLLALLAVMLGVLMLRQKKREQ